MPDDPKKQQITANGQRPTANDETVPDGAAAGGVGGALTGAAVGGVVGDGLLDEWKARHLAEVAG